jgi:hypothetical protein
VAKDFERVLVRLLEQPEGYVFGERGGKVSELTFGAPESNGAMRATTTAAASRGEMLLAMSKGVVPRGTSRWEPSGS